MKLGAQFYSIRTACTTPEDLKESFRKIKEIGYEVVQISGVCDISAEELKSFSEEYSLPITSTHKPYSEILNNTDYLINYHKTINCPIIGLGGMPTENRKSLEGVRAFINSMKEPIKKIKDAGLTFTYHNHGFEFDVVDGVKIYDVLLEEAPEMHFIHDVYWSTFAGEDPIKYINIIGKDKRMTNIHFKDMRTAPAGPICPCGEGVIDFKPIIKACKEYGIEYALVEQDNAPDLGDVFEQMATSFKNLKPLF